MSKQNHYNQRNVPLGTFVNLYIRWLVSKQCARAMVLGQEYLQYTDHLCHFRRDTAAGRLERFGGPPDSDARVAIWRSHKDAFKENNGYENIRHRYRRATEVLSEAVTKDPEITQVINYTSSYAQLEQDIARAFPSLSVTGVDSEAITRLNAKEFSAPNLQFATAEGPLSFAREADVQCAVFSHLHTAALWLPDLVEETYKVLGERGCRYILAYEPDGFSRELGGFYRYSDQPRPSALYRQQLLLHNYPSLLTKAGFQVVHSEMTKPPHPMPDFRSIVLLAKRVEA